MNLNKPLRRYAALALVIAATFLTGCASVPMASREQDQAAKNFTLSDREKAGLYVFRDSNFGAALKRLVSLDGAPLFQSAAKTYVYKEIEPGAHRLTTESEFGDNSIEFVAERGKPIFVRNYIKMGVFVGGANLEVVNEGEGRKAVNECSLAVPMR